MNQIAIIGFGNHIIKNIIPAINRMDNLSIEAIYVRHINDYQDEANKQGITLKSINDNIDNEIQWVYIATPVLTHYELISKYLKMGKNIICEKPLTNNFANTKALFKLSDELKLKLYEVCMYQYHKQFIHLKDTINKNLDSIKNISAKFTIPHLDKDNIRYKKIMGGALLEVGYYPISLMLLLFGKPKNITVNKHTQKSYEVDLFGSALLEYDNFSCYAEWGIGLGYANEVVITTEKQIIEYQRIFSKPETFTTKVKIIDGINIKDIKIGKDDQFVNMFNSLLLPNKYYKDDRLTALNFLNVV